MYKRQGYGYSGPPGGGYGYAAPPQAADPSSRAMAPPGGGYGYAAPPPAADPSAEPTWRHMQLHGTDGRLKPPGSASTAPAPAAPPPPIPGGTGRLPGGRPREGNSSMLWATSAQQIGPSAARGAAPIPKAPSEEAAREKAKRSSDFTKNFAPAKGQGGGFVFGKGGGW